MSGDLPEAQDLGQEATGSVKAWLVRGRRSFARHFSAVSEKEAECRMNVKFPPGLPRVSRSSTAFGLTGRCPRRK